MQGQVEWFIWAELPFASRSVRRLRGTSTAVRAFGIEFSTPVQMSSVERCMPLPALGQTFPGDEFLLLGSPRRVVSIHTQATNVEGTRFITLVRYADRCPEPHAQCSRRPRHEAQGAD